MYYCKPLQLLFVHNNIKQYRQFTLKISIYNFTDTGNTENVYNLCHTTKLSNVCNITRLQDLYNFKLLQFM